MSRDSKSLRNPYDILELVRNSGENHRIAPLTVLTKVICIFCVKQECLDPDVIVEQ